MRITIISAEYPPSKSGEAANSFFLAKTLADLRVDVTVITRVQPVNDRLERVTVLPVMRKWNWRSAGFLVRTIAESRPDAVLLMVLGAMYDFHPMTTFLPDLMRKGGVNTRFVARFENPLSKALPYDMPLLSKMYWKLVMKKRGNPGYGTLLQNSDSIITLCDYHAELLKNADSSIGDKLHVIPPPSNVRFSDGDEHARITGRTMLGADQDEPLLGYMGYVYANKGVDTLLRGLKILRDQGLRHRLVVLGGGVELIDKEDDYFGRMKSLANELGVGDQVQWLGSFDPTSEQTANLINAIDVFVLPFDNGVHLNNSSVASLMTFGKPLVTTTSEHADRSIELSGGAVFVEAKCPEALAVEMARVVADRELQRQMSAASQQFAEKYFSWKSCIRETLECLGARHLSP